MPKGSEAFQVLKALLKPTLLILVWMTLLRLLLYVTLFTKQLGIHPDLGKALFAGFRFDLCVLGFLWIPIVVITWLSAFFTSPRKLFFAWKLYFVVIILLTFDLYWMDLFWTAVSNARLNSEFFTADSRVILDQGWKIVGNQKAWICTLAMGISSLGLVLWLYGLKIKKTYDLPNRAQLAGEILLSVFLVAFAARGTWTPHHINIEHAQVSSEPLMNQIPLNPLWNLDK